MASERVRDDLNPYPEYAVGYVTFMRYGGKWTAHFWQDPPASMEYWRITVRVPDKLLRQPVENQVEDAS